MNERIKQLAEQAGYLRDGFGFGHWDMPECKKFAELIVNECALVANEKKASAKRTINLDLNISCLFTIIMTSLRGHKFRCKKRRKIAAFKIFGQNCIKITTVLT